MRMSRKYFGTDGIRGRANTPPITADMALKVAMATAHVLRNSQNRQKTDRAVIGKDTRLSCYMIEQAMAAGFGAMGMDVIFTGPMPTPGIAMLTRSLRADIGVMISASHNPFEDNGIKLFGADGFKLDDALEQKIEDMIDADFTDYMALPADLGKSSRLDDAPGRYAESIKRSYPRGFSLDGLRVVVDCAHGAAYKIAPQVLWELEAKVHAIGVSPNGRNINDGYGATAVGNLQKEVLDQNAHIGIALDGDADRLIVIDEKGRKIDGDQLMATLALHMKEQGRLNHDTLVSTVMSNLGLERFLKNNNIKLERAAVGDRYVMEIMRREGYNLGGEQSGHIIMSDHGTTGDGLLAALQILAVIKKKCRPPSEVLNHFEPVPQILKNVRFEKGKLSPLQILDDVSVKEALMKAEDLLSNDGRILVRPSGTEPVIRVMAEGDDESRIHEIVDDVCSVIEAAAK